MTGHYCLSVQLDHSNVADYWRKSAWLWPLHKVCIESEIIHSTNTLRETGIPSWQLQQYVTGYLSQDIQFTVYYQRQFTVYYTRQHKNFQWKQLDCNNFKRDSTNSAAQARHKHCMASVSCCRNIMYTTAQGNCCNIAHAQMEITYHYFLMNCDATKFVHHIAKALEVWSRQVSGVSLPIHPGCTSPLAHAFLQMRSKPAKVNISLQTTMFMKVTTKLEHKYKYIK